MRFKDIIATEMTQMAYQVLSIKAIRDATQNQKEQKVTKTTNIIDVRA